MPESHAEKFKRFFAFGSHDKSGGSQSSESPEEAELESPEETEPELSEEAALEPTEQTDLEPTDEDELESADEDEPDILKKLQSTSAAVDAFAIPMGNPLAKVWDKSNQPGMPTLNPQARAQNVGGDVSSKTVEASFYKILRELAAMSQRWLDKEADAAQARAKTEAAEAKLNAKAPSEPAGGAKPDAGASAPSASDRADTQRGPDLEAPTKSASPVPLDVDEMGQVLISGDGMAAWLFLLPPSGKGNRLSLADMQSLLRNSHVTSGVNQSALFAAFSSRPYFCLCPIASGTPPTEGKDGWTEDHFPRNFVRKIGDVDSDTVDYRAQSSVQKITKGAVICDIHFPVEGTAGLRVDGIAVPPRPPKPAEVPSGTNTALSEDRTKLLATVDGFLEFKGSVFNVKNLLNISSDVDYSTGNIDFHGDVTIRGDVREQFSVKATGNITINGLVEAATVEAGGDVVISNGVSGNNQAVIRGTHVRAKRLESCTVYADSLESDYILTSSVFCNDSIQVSGSRGAIIGGQVLAANYIKASCIGSQSGRPTEVTLGVQPKIREELLSIRKDLIFIRKKATELVKRSTYLKKRLEAQNRPDPRSSEAIQSAEENLVQLAEQGNSLLARQTELEDQLNKLHNCRLECGTVYPGVKLTIGNANRNIETVINHCIAVFDVEEQDIKFV